MEGEKGVQNEIILQKKKAIPKVARLTLFFRTMRS